MLYFDHNATTPVDPEVAQVFAQAITEVWGNASSIHMPGQFARQRLEQARRAIANLLGCAPAEFTFTGGGTESNNIAILGLVRNLPGPHKHVISTAFEHPAVLECCRELEREGVSVSYVNRVGQIASELRDETVLVSVMHANNETGTLQPIENIAALVRHRRSSGQKIWLHSDGVQALGKTSVHVGRLGVDLYSVSAHKIYAPKGVGGLFVKKGTPVHSIQFGGRHERERRPGTENVPGAIAFARAAELCADPPTAALRDRFEQKIRQAFPGIPVNGADAPRLPNTSNIRFAGVSGEAMVIALDICGMAVSSGSACSSGSVEPSHALLAMGLTREEARSSVRFSFGRFNSEQDIDALVEAVIASVRRLAKAAAKEVAHV